MSHTQRCGRPPRELVRFSGSPGNTCPTTSGGFPLDLTGDSADPSPPPGEEPLPAEPLRGQICEVPDSSTF